MIVEVIMPKLGIYEDDVTLIEWIAADGSTVSTTVASEGRRGLLQGCARNRGALTNSAATPSCSRPSASLQEPTEQGLLSFAVSTVTGFPACRTLDARRALPDPEPQLHRMYRGRQKTVLRCIRA